MQTFWGRRAAVAWRQGSDNTIAATAKPRFGSQPVQSLSGRHVRQSGSQLRSDGTPATFNAAWAANCNTVIG